MEKKIQAQDDQVFSQFNCNSYLTRVLLWVIDFVLKKT
jgi:hypothetical protein